MPITGGLIFSNLMCLVLIKKMRVSKMLFCNIFPTLLESFMRIIFKEHFPFYGTPR